jgi:hypothetical protein
MLFCLTGFFLRVDTVVRDAENARCFELSLDGGAGSHSSPDFSVDGVLVRCFFGIPSSEKYWTERLGSFLRSLTFSRPLASSLFSSRDTGEFWCDGEEGTGLVGEVGGAATESML